MGLVDETGHGFGRVAGVPLVLLLDPGHAGVLHVADGHTGCLAAQLEVADVAHGGDRRRGDDRRGGGAAGRGCARRGRDRRGGLDNGQAVGIEAGVDGHQPLGNPAFCAARQGDVEPVAGVVAAQQLQDGATVGATGDGAVDDAGASADVGRQIDDGRSLARRAQIGGRGGGRRARRAGGGGRDGGFGGGFGRGRRRFGHFGPANGDSQLAQVGGRIAQHQAGLDTVVTGVLGRRPGEVQIGARTAGDDAVGGVAHGPGDGRAAGLRRFARAQEAAQRRGVGRAAAQFQPAHGGAAQVVFADQLQAVEQRRLGDEPDGLRLAGLLKGVAVGQRLAVPLQRRGRAAEGDFDGRAGVDL